MNRIFNITPGIGETEEALKNNFKVIGSHPSYLGPNLPIKKYIRPSFQNISFCKKHKNKGEFLSNLIINHHNSTIYRLSTKVYNILFLNITGKNVQRQISIPHCIFFKITSQINKNNMYT